MTTKRIYSSINITTGSSLTATNLNHTLGSLICATNGNVGIGTTAPSTALHVNGTISQGGYATLGLSSTTYATGWSTLQFGNTQFSSRITNNTSSITLQDPGIYMFVVKLNCDTATGATGTIALRAQYFDGTNWIDSQYNEQYLVFTNQTEFLTNFTINSNANQQWRIQITPSTTLVFSVGIPSDYWSRWMIYKIG